MEKSKTITGLSLITVSMLYLIFLICFYDMPVSAGVVDQDLYEVSVELDDQKTIIEKEIPITNEHLEGINDQTATIDIDNELTEDSEISNEQLNIMIESINDNSDIFSNQELTTLEENLETNPTKDVNVERTILEFDETSTEEVVDPPLKLETLYITKALCVRPYKNASESLGPC